MQVVRFCDNLLDSGLVRLQVALVRKSPSSPFTNTKKIASTSEMSRMITIVAIGESSMTFKNGSAVWKRKVSFCFAVRLHLHPNLLPSF